MISRPRSPMSQSSQLIWLRADGEQMTEAEWHDENARFFGMLIDVRDAEGARDTVMILLNGDHRRTLFTLPAPPRAGRWTLLLDTTDSRAGATDTFERGAPYGVAGRSLVLFSCGKPGG